MERLVHVLTRTTFFYLLKFFNIEIKCSVRNIGNHITILIFHNSFHHGDDHNFIANDVVQKF